MVRDFDAEIKSLEEKLTAIREQLDCHRQEFLRASAEFVRAWYWQQTEDIVKDNPERTKRLGVDRLSKLKAKVAELQTTTSVVISEVVDDDQLWWSEDRSFPTHCNKPRELDKALRLATGRLALILEKFRYLSRHGNVVWRELHRNGSRRQSVGRKQQASQVPCFPGRLDWSKDMKRIMAEYISKVVGYNECVQQIRTLKQLELRLEAEYLWESA